MICEPLLKPDVVAKLLGVSTKTLERWRADQGGKGPPYIRISSKIIRYRNTDINAFLEGQMSEKG